MNLLALSPVLIEVAAYCAALVITLILAAYCTPARWWRQLNLRAIGITLCGTLACAQLLLHWILPARAALAAAPSGAAQAASGKITPAASLRSAPALSTAAVPALAPSSTQSFTVYRNLNLRRAAGVQAARVGSVPAGALVTPSGARQGDWWHISACYQGRCSSGWVSSLWLRRSSEREGLPHEP